MKMNTLVPQVTLSKRSRFTTQLLTHLRTPLYANAYALMANQIASAGLGILYWMLAARLYSPEVVGQNSAIISILMLLAALSELGLKEAMIRFIPRMRAQTARTIIYTYGANLIATVLFGMIFFVANHYLRLVTNLWGEPSGIGWLILAAMAWGVFYVQDGVLMGLRQAVWVLIENSLFSFSKIVLLVVAVRVFYDYGIVASWFLPTPALVLLVNVLVFWRFLPKHVKIPSDQATPITTRQVVTSTTGDYFGTLLAEACARLLPLLVIGMLGSSANAYFYQAWIVALPLLFIPWSVITSFTVEAAANMSQIAVYSRRTLRHVALIVMPMALALFLAAPFVLGLFGEVYAHEGTTLLRWLALATPALIVNTWYLGYARVLGDVKAIILNQALVSVLTLGLSYWWLPTFGISSIGVAWLISQAVVAVLVLAKTAPLLLNRAIHNDN
jgi:O-antigen/teichoic acid export membrane protein